MLIEPNFNSEVFLHANLGFIVQLQHAIVLFFLSPTLFAVVTQGMSCQSMAPQRDERQC